MLKISHGTRIKNIDDTNGYGTATVGMLKSLNRLGYVVNQNDPTADVEIWFDQPQHWRFSKGVYKIGYHPWESTELKRGWPEIMNQCDEIWTPSPLIADWYRKYAGIRVPVYVYEHGIDDAWQPIQRKREDEFYFLHVGAEALRKGGKETMSALRDAFPNDRDVKMKMKIMSPGWGINSLPRVEFLNGQYKIEQLIELYANCHAFVYPSYGEGFGLTPLQALLTGMPTITVPRWAPYRKFLDERISVPSKMVGSPWPQVHPGCMLKPDYSKLVESMRYAFDNYEELVDRHLGQVKEVKRLYSWDRLTSKTFVALENRLKNI